MQTKNGRTYPGIEPAMDYLTRLEMSRPTPEEKAEFLAAFEKAKEFFKKKHIAMATSKLKSAQEPGEFIIISGVTEEAKPELTLVAMKPRYFVRPDGRVEGMTFNYCYDPLSQLKPSSKKEEDES